MEELVLDLSLPLGASKFSSLPPRMEKGILVRDGSLLLRFNEGLISAARGSILILHVLVYTVPLLLLLS